MILAALLAGARLLLHLALRSVYGGLTFLRSATEIERTRAALSFAAHPAFAPLGILYWLPLPFWLNGSLLRLWPDALVVPFAVNTAASALTVAGIVLWTWELAGEGAALVAGLAALFNTTGLFLGIGGSADPLMHAAMVWALLFWARFERSGRSSQAWLCAACLALGSASRYEVWLVAAALTAAAVLDRRRRAVLPLAAAWLFPLGWAAYNWSAAGSPWSFVSQTFGAEIRDTSLPRWRLSLSFISDFLDIVPPWLTGLVLVSAASGERRLPRSYWLSLGAVAFFFLVLHPFGMVQIDDHHWSVFLLALPAAGAAVAGWLSGLPSARRFAAAAAAFALLGASQAVSFFSYHEYFERRFVPLHSVYMRLRSLRRAGALTAEDSVLVELPVGPGWDLNRYALWTLEPGMRGFFDRELKVVLFGRLDPGGASSMLDKPPAELGAWLRERRVRAIVAFQHGPALSSLGWRRAGGPAEAGVWFAPGDALAGNWAP